MSLRKRLSPQGMKYLLSARQRIQEAKGSQEPPCILPGLLSSELPAHLDLAFLRLIPVRLRPRRALIYGKGDPPSPLQALLLERTPRTRRFPTTPIEIQGKREKLRLFQKLG